MAQTPIGFSSPLGFLALIIVTTLVALLILFILKQNKKITQSRDYTKELEQTIQEKIQIEEMLQQSITSYRSLLENIPAITYIVGMEEAPLNPTIYIGPQIEKITGYSSEEFVNDPLFWTKLIHPDDRERVIAESETADQTGEPFITDYRIVTNENKLFWFHDESVLVKNDHGQPLYRLGIWSNITEQKQAEAEREAVIKELEVRNAEMERFLYIASHDLKSPVVTIKGFLGMLKKDMEENQQDKVQKDFSRISDATEKMGTLLSELLELSRIGRIVNPPEEVDLNKLTQEILEIFNERILSREIKVLVSPELPSVYGDHIRLREVFENLIENAIKYMENQTNPQIEVGKRNSGNEIIIYVKDNGMGIEPKFHTRIFDLFEKLNPSIDGTGVGLALIKRIIEVHGGRIWVESEGYGKGSTFCFTIPTSRKIYAI